MTAANHTRFHMGVNASWYDNRKFLYAFCLVASDIDPISSSKTSIAVVMSSIKVWVLLTCWALGVMHILAMLIHYKIWLRTLL